MSKIMAGGSAGSSHNNYNSSHNNNINNNNNNHNNSRVEDDESVLDISEQTERPADIALYQQRIPAWHPILDPVWVIIALFYLGIIMVPVGFKMNQLQDIVVEEKNLYDGFNIKDPICGINETFNANRTCELTITASADMEAPVLLYYELTNFHQNHRKYYKGYDQFQLAGYVGPQTTLSKKNCAPLDKLGNITLNPCGVIANTFFNDYFTLLSGNDASGQPLQMMEEGIAWRSDIEYVYKQPEGFHYENCSACDATCCEGSNWSCKEPYVDQHGNCYRYYYPNDEKTQYLYETYPDIISPLDGVTNEHFIVWMRVAPQPNFRKLYGWFNQSIAKGEQLVFRVNANYVVTKFQGTKSIVLTTTTIFGGRNGYIPMVFVGCGAFFLLAGLFFLGKHLWKPRRLADKKYLIYKQD